MRGILIFLFLIHGFCGVAHALDSSYLIILTSGMSADDLNDAISSEQVPHIEEVMKESVRFTHAYTTSVMEAAAFASVLTGLYPWEHGVRDNRASLYNPGVKSLPQVLQSQGAETFFISGGAPFLRKLAVSFGFDEFDDKFKVPGYMLPATEVVDKAKIALEGKPDGIPFFGVLYFADLLYFADFTKEKKYQQIDLAFSNLKKLMVKQKIWDSTNIIYLGLRGAGRMPFLYDDSVHIPLLIKPARKPRDLAPTWKVDNAVTLADLGKTLFSLVNELDQSNSGFDVIDFSKLLEAKTIELVDRIVYAESQVIPLLSLRQEGWVYFPREKKLFNTYTDRFQTNNLYGKENDITKVFEKALAPLRPLFPSLKIKLDYSALIQKMNVAKILFSPLSSHDDKMRAINNSLFYNEADNQMKLWFFDYLLEKNEISKNEKLIKKMKIKMNDCLPQIEWLKSSQMNINSKKIFQHCVDKETLAWLQAFVSYKNKRNREASLLYDIAKGMTDRRHGLETLSQNNWLNSLTWDFPKSLPEGIAPFTYFAKQVEGTEMGDFIKKKPAL